MAELELIVESAETEIARLRGQLHQQQVGTGEWGDEGEIGGR